MNERWIIPQSIKEFEQSNRRKDSIFSGFLTLALLVMLAITYYAKDLLKIPVLLCFMILLTVSFIAFVKNGSSDHNKLNWLTILRKIFKVIASSLFWILLLNKLV